MIQICSEYGKGQGQEYGAIRKVMHQEQSMSNIHILVCL